MQVTINKINLILVSLLFIGCASRPAVVNESQAPWRGYDRCESSGQYRFIGGVTFAVLVGNKLSTVTWTIVGDGPVEIVFADEDPKITVSTEPDQKNFAFAPNFILSQEIDPTNPIHGIPVGMKTEYDYTEKKLYYGRFVRPFFGHPYIERQGEVKNPRFTRTVTHGRILSGAPQVGYKRYSMYNQFVFENKSPKSLVVHIPSFKLNGEVVEAQNLKFTMGMRSNTDPGDSMLCNGFEPQGLKYYYLKMVN